MKWVQNVKKVSIKELWYFIKNQWISIISLNRFWLVNSYESTMSMTQMFQFYINFIQISYEFI